MKLLVSALEPSANLHLESLLKKVDNIEIDGIFDKRFGKAKYYSDKFSVMGIMDVIPKIFQAKKAIKELAVLSLECDKVLLIDAPAFNLPLAKAIKKINPTIEIIYYILPKAWVWKKGRIKVVEKFCDIQASIFPFENKFYKNSLFVGNPLIEQIKEYKKGVTQNGIVAFLAGSRKSEIKALMPVFRGVAKSIKEKKLLIVPKNFSGREIEEIYGDISEFEISFDTHTALLNSDFAFVCSGTASLEAALIGTPFLLVYIAKKIDYFIAKSFIDLKFVGLANIILDFENLKPLHRELLQNEVNRENLLKEYKELDREKFFESSKELRELLSINKKEELFKLISSKTLRLVN